MCVLDQSWMTLGTESLTEEEASRWEYLVQDSVWYSPSWSEKLKKDKHNKSNKKPIQLDVT